MIYTHIVLNVYKYSTHSTKYLWEACAYKREHVVEKQGGNVVVGDECGFWW